MNILVCTGDSITAGASCFVDWPTKLRALLGVDWARTNRSQSGQGVTNIVSGAATFYSQFPEFDTKIFIFEAGTNDLNDEITAEEMYDTCTPLIDGAANANWDLIIWQRITPSGSSSGWNSTIQEKADDYWGMIQSYTVPDGSTTKFVAFDNHPIIGNGDATQPGLQITPVNFRLSEMDGNNDGLHPNDACGQARAEALYDIIIEQLYS